MTSATETSRNKATMFSRLVVSAAILLGGASLEVGHAIADTPGFLAPIPADSVSLEIPPYEQSSLSVNGPLGGIQETNSTPVEQSMPYFDANGNPLQGSALEEIQQPPYDQWDTSLQPTTPSYIVQSTIPLDGPEK